MIYFGNASHIRIILSAGEAPQGGGCCPAIKTCGWGRFGDSAISRESWFWHKTISLPFSTPSSIFCCLGDKFHPKNDYISVLARQYPVIMWWRLASWEEVWILSHFISGNMLLKALQFQGAVSFTTPDVELTGHSRSRHRCATSCDTAKVLEQLCWWIMFLYRTTRSRSCSAPGNTQSSQEANVQA